jgi:hypothetical protein
MDELVNLVVKKTGISQDDARKAVEVIVSALKSKLPGPIASHLDSFISGGMNTLAGEAGEMLKGKLGGSLRRRQIVDRYRPDRSTLKKRRASKCPPQDSPTLAGSVYRDRGPARTNVIRSSPPCLLL